jgi:hypothetical protein
MNKQKPRMKEGLRIGNISWIFAMSDKEILLSSALIRCKTAPCQDELSPGTLGEPACHSCLRAAYSYPGLHVMDASVIPTSIGPNPALTIAALAEHMCSQIQ